ncbi:MAG: MBL fold metallo-hydrolase [Burkholderiales bacterium]|nr:MBL fold metallo-hydrolase [Burkholderiales bacterium]
MESAIEARLVNPSFGDPGVYVKFGARGRALLFDLGDSPGLGARDLLRVSHVFVSHTHVDHFIGFDRLVRTCADRSGTVRLFGPSGFVTKVERRLGSYTWDRRSRDGNGLVLGVTEIDETGRTASAEFAARSGFARTDVPAGRVEDGVITDDAAFRVRCVTLEHRTPCLGFALEEKARARVRADALDRLGLEAGAWLVDAKEAVVSGAADDAPVLATVRGPAGPRPTRVPFGDIKDAFEMLPGRKISYVTDIVFNEANLARVESIARDLDILFIECVFLEADARHAARKQHLTARQAGVIARAVRARQVVPFHFSARYTGREAELRAELERSWRAT